MDDFTKDPNKEISADEITSIELVQEFKENDVIASGWKLPTGEVCEWLAVVKKWTREDDGDGNQDYTAKVALCTKASRTRDNFGLDLDNDDCSAAEWSRPATEAEKEKLKSALYLSSNPKANAILKEVFGIDQKPEKEEKPGKPEDTLKPFDRVLVRDDDDTIWIASVYSHKNNGLYYASGFEWFQCIPYEGNEHLLGTKDKPTAVKA